MGAFCFELPDVSLQGRTIRQGSLFLRAIMTQLPVDFSQLPGNEGEPAPSTVKKPAILAGFFGPASAL
jgi:hypothetical protein